MEQQTHRELLERFQRLSPEDRHIFLDFMRLLVKEPDFQAAVLMETPAGQECPDWETTKRIVSEWTTKKHIGGVA